MKQLKILLLAISVSITLLLTFIISYLYPYELLLKDYIYFIVVINALVLVTICLITLLVIHGIKYYNTKETSKQDNELFPWNKNHKIHDKLHKTLVESTNFLTKIGLLNCEYLFIPGYTVMINKQQYKVIHKFRTDLSDKDIYGLKWDYIFIKDSNGKDYLDKPKSNDIHKESMIDKFIHSDSLNTTVGKVLTNNMDERLKAFDNDTILSFETKDSLLKHEEAICIGDCIDLNRSLYKTELFNHTTQYSKADILGSKYVFIWQSNK